MRSSIYDLLGDIKQRRQAIPPEAVVIGEYQRRPQRIGRPVTQEELAEALGISREWYCNLENGKCTEASPELVKKIALALHDRRATRRMQPGGEHSPLPSLAEFRHYIGRVAAASSYFDAAVEAMETATRFLRTTCLGAVDLDGDAEWHYAVGSHARFWTPFCAGVFHDAHRTLRHGGVGVRERLPSAEEVAHDDDVVITFERISDDGSTSFDSKYEYACTSEVWREFNAALQIRSVIVVALRDHQRYRGIATFAWAAPRNIELVEIELLRTLVSVLEMVPRVPAGAC
jgi:transcriptional regulator with XRE-family HTH domain